MATDGGWRPALSERHDGSHEVLTLLAEKWTTFVLGARKYWDDRDVAVTQAPRFAIMGPEPRPSYPRSLPP